MCSIKINATVDDILKSKRLQKDKEMIEQRLANFAKDASPQHKGALDGYLMKRMPSELKGIRKKRIGRHRVYYYGHHTQCCYNSFYIKVFKKKGVNDEDNKRFQKILIKAKNDLPSRLLLTDS